MDATLKILIVGGYGTFGGRLVQLLEHEPRLGLLVAGRSLDKASAFCQSRRFAKATLVPVAFERDTNVVAQLAELRPDVLVDASGPFQAYGEGRYRLIEACIAQRVDYLDLADGSEFVDGVKAYDAATRAAGIFVLSGVSSFPVLTAAVVRRLSAGMGKLHTIRGGIAPSPYAGVGRNVISAIASYAGRAALIRKDGANCLAYPFTESVRFTIAPPGCVPLKSTLFSLVDVPDLRALPELWPDVRTVWMGAGPVPESLHRALIAFAWLVRLRLLRSLSFLSPVMFRVTNWLRWGEHRGGMFVQVQGEAVDGRPPKRSWHLLAEGDDGPLIPSMAVAALVRKTLDGQRPAPGARPAVRDLELEDYEPLFANRSIKTGVRDDSTGSATPLFARALGSAWSELAPEVRQLHSGESTRLFEGRCAVERGSGLLARLVASVFRFPQAGTDVPVSVLIEAKNGTESWTRTFAGRSFSSRHALGTGKSERLLCESFGPLSFGMALVPDGDRLLLVLRRWTCLGISIPLALAPQSNSWETVEDGRFRFHVEIGHPWVGLIVRYRGWLRAALLGTVAHATDAPRVGEARSIDSTERSLDHQ